MIVATASLKSLFPTTGNHKTDKARAIEWARALLALGDRDWVIFDSETTSLHDAEIVEVGLLWPDGTVALSSLVRPDCPIPPDATAIHGITDAMVKGESVPTFEEILPQMTEIMHGKKVVVYNVGYDAGVVHGCIRRRNYDQSAIDVCLPDDRTYQIAVEKSMSVLYAEAWINTCSWECAMLAYAAYCGVLGRYGHWKWQKLPAVEGAESHRALGDCISTLALIKRMAEG